MRRLAQRAAQATAPVDGVALAAHHERKRRPIRAEAPGAQSDVELALVASGNNKGKEPPLAQVVKDISPHGLLDTYHCERHPAAARALKHTMAQSFLQRSDVRIDAVRDTIADMLSFDGPRKLVAGLASGLDVGYDLGEGHPLLGRGMPDLDLITPDGRLRIFTLLHEARPVLLNLGKPGSIDITPWADRVQHIDADYRGTWDLPVLGAVTGPAAVLIRPDGHVAWVGDGTQTGLREALTTWFGPPVEPRRESARLRARRPWAQVGDPRRRTSQEHERGAERERAFRSPESCR